MRKRKQEDTIPDRSGQVWEDMDSNSMFVVVGKPIVEKNGETFHPIYDLLHSYENGWYEYEEGWEAERMMKRHT